MYSVDFAEIESLQHRGEWDEAADFLIAAAKNVEKGGADFVLICTNTMHKLAEEIQCHINIPLLHIADATAEAIRAKGIKAVALLGTRFTMEEDFYTGRLIRNFNLDVIVPNADEMEIVHSVIYDELCAGKINPSSKVQYTNIMSRLIKKGAEGVILGCTEIGLLIKEDDCRVPLFDTTKIHAEAAVEFALGSS